MFTPETVRHFPNAAPRKKKGGGKKRRSAILTDTPEKAIEEEMVQKQKTVNRPLKSKAKKSRKSQREIYSSYKDDCLVWVEPYSNSRPREAWIQCQTSKK